MTINGLCEVMADLHSEGRQANREVVEEMMRRLEARKNYIPSSASVRREYAHLLLEEYKSYVSDQERAERIG